MRASGLRVSSCSRRRAWCHRASVSMMPVGPSHLVAAKSRRVSFWRLAQRTKFPASRMGGVIAGQPGVEVALAGGAQPEAAGGEPVQQRDGGSDVPLDGDGLAVGDVLAAGAAPEPAQGVPGGVAVQQLPLAGIVTSGDESGDPVFEADHVLVAGRQRAGGDQDATQVPDRLAAGQLVQGGVGQRSLACRELSQDRCGGVLVQPVQHGVRAVVAGQVASCKACSRG